MVCFEIRDAYEQVRTSTDSEQMYLTSTRVRRTSSRSGELGTGLVAPETPLANRTVSIATSATVPVFRTTCRGVALLCALVRRAFAVDSWLHCV